MIRKEKPRKYWIFRGLLLFFDILLNYRLQN